MLKAKELEAQVITITCMLHEKLAADMQKIKEKSSRIEGENLIILTLLALILGLVLHIKL